MFNGLLKTLKIQFKHLAKLSHVGLNADWENVCNRNTEYVPKLVTVNYMRKAVENLL
jgi:hypothetical protein